MLYLFNLKNLPKVFTLKQKNIYFYTFICIYTSLIISINPGNPLNSSNQLKVLKQRNEANGLNDQLQTIKSLEHKNYNEKQPSILSLKESSNPDLKSFFLTYRDCFEAIQEENSSENALMQSLSIESGNSEQIYSSEKSVVSIISNENSKIDHLIELASKDELLEDLTHETKSCFE